jgi:hypothetical protein
MDDLGRNTARSFERVRAETVVRLRARRAGIVQAIYAQIQEAVPDGLFDLTQLSWSRWSGIRRRSLVVGDGSRIRWV